MFSPTLMQHLLPIIKRMSDVRSLRKAVAVAVGVRFFLLRG